MLVALVAVGCFQVEPQQGLGVGRPQVEPPRAAIDGETVEVVLLEPCELRRHLLDDGVGVGDLRVDLALDE